MPIADETLRMLLCDCVKLNEMCIKFKCIVWTYAGKNTPENMRIDSYVQYFLFFIFLTENTRLSFYSQCLDRNNVAGSLLLCMLIWFKLMCTGKKKRMTESQHRLAVSHCD